MNFFFRLLEFLELVYEMVDVVKGYNKLFIFVDGVLIVLN